jgi:hypothetical protein
MLHPEINRRRLLQGGALIGGAVLADVAIPMYISNRLDTSEVSSPSVDAAEIKRVQDSQAQRVRGMVKAHPSHVEFSGKYGLVSRLHVDDVPNPYELTVLSKPFFNEAGTISTKTIGYSATIASEPFNLRRYDPFDFASNVYSFVSSNELTVGEDRFSLLERSKQGDVFDEQLFARGEFGTDGTAATEFLYDRTHPTRAPLAADVFTAMDHRFHTMLDGIQQGAPLHPPVLST